MSSSFDKLANVIASTQRQGVVSEGLVGDMETHIASLNCMPLWPVDEEIRQMAGISSFAELKATLVADNPDIVEGDTLTVESIVYKIRAVAEWYWSVDSNESKLLVVEEIK